ncbi:hypothetical protein GH714_028041 [Hevea brasiliensis]|uniref:Retroviral polymerase SH3-like domain-containing protein n=1 Tax=Hevea brasiliensis TaxID=3981 RepID=A0A6A6N2X4_HEVBR|nr:hypothetical protein GH714_028041 [Hevea brasiliensis]
MARSLLKAKELPDYFWGEAVATAVYLLNISPTKAVLNQTPYEAWMGKKPRVSHLKAFGCVAYSLVNFRSKLDEKSEKCIFIGYSPHSKAYRLYNPAGCLDDRKSTYSNIFSFGSGAITWSSKKQETVALSLSKAEYAAATSAARQALWLRKLIEDFSLEQKGATKIFCDNQSTIAIAKNPAFRGRTKHIVVHHHFIRKLVTNGKVVLKFRSTNEQTADVFTKSLSQAKHQLFILQLGVYDFESRGSVERMIQNIDG